jgi:hypothetical protein
MWFLPPFFLHGRPQALRQGFSLFFVLLFTYILFICFFVVRVLVSVGFREPFSKWAGIL